MGVGNWTEKNMVAHASDIMVVCRYDTRRILRIYLGGRHVGKNNPGKKSKEKNQRKKNQNFYMVLSYFLNFNYKSYDRLSD